MRGRVFAPLNKGDLASHRRHRIFDEGYDTNLARISVADMVCQADRIT
jgi:hypothetical protein